MTRARRSGRPVSSAITCPRTRPVPFAATGRADGSRGGAPGAGPAPLGPGRDGSLAGSGEPAAWADNTVVQAPRATTVETAETTNRAAMRVMVGWDQITPRRGKE